MNTLVQTVPLSLVLVVDNVLYSSGERLCCLIFDCTCSVLNSNVNREAIVCQKNKIK